MSGESLILPLLGGTNPYQVLDMRAGRSWGAPKSAQELWVLHTPITPVRPMARTHSPYSNCVRLLTSPEHTSRLGKGRQTEKGQWHWGTEWQSTRLASVFSTLGESTCHSGELFSENLGYLWGMVQWIFCGAPSKTSALKVLLAFPLSWITV